MGTAFGHSIFFTGTDRNIINPERQLRMAKESVTSTNTYLPYRDNEALTIHAADGSASGNFYQMNGDYLVTYEYCSGTEPDDYINFITLSPLDRTMSQEPFSFHDAHFGQNPTHFHDYFELMIVLEGSVTQRIENTDYRYEAGMCCLITRSLCHFETFNTASRILFVGLKPEYIDDIFKRASASPFREEKSFLDGPICGFINSDLKTPGKKEYLDFIPTMKNVSSKKDLHFWSEEIINAMMNPHFGSQDLVQGALCSILDYLSDPSCYHCTKTALEHNSDFLIFARAEHMIRANHGRISRSDLSSALGYSGDYINRIIRRHAHMSLSEYCLQNKLFYAAHLLESGNGTGNMSISEVCALAGFSNRTYFYKAFEAQYGVSPRQYKEESLVTLSRPGGFAK
jgi:AraC-like DNA-binding protein